MMKIQITNVNMAYEDGEVVGVQVYFHGYTEDRFISVNGTLPLSAEEYEGNESVVKMVGLVRAELAGLFVEQVPSN